MTGGITSYPSYFRVPSGYHAVILPGWFTWIPPHHSSEVWRDDLMRTDLQLIAVHRREVRGQTFPWRANMTGDEAAKSFEEICWTVNGWDFPDLIDCSFCWFWENISTHPKIRTWSEHDPTRYPTSFLVIQSCGLHHKLHPKKHPSETNLVASQCGTKSVRNPQPGTWPGTCALGRGARTAGGVGGAEFLSRLVGSHDMSGPAWYDDMMGLFEEIH